MQRKRLALATVLLTSALALNAATNKWETSAAAGLTITKGNSDTTLGTFSLNSTRKWTPHEVLLGASATYGTTEKEVTMPNGTKHDKTETTTANASAFGQYNYSFTERWYGGIRADLLHDAIADIKYRVTISPLIGYYAVKEPNTTLKFEAGPSGVMEKQGDETHEYVALRLGERFEHKFNPRARMWQSLDYIPQVDRWGNYLIIAELGAEAAITDKFSLRAVLQDMYDNEPAEGRKKNDLKLITSLVYKF